MSLPLLGTGADLRARRGAPPAGCREQGGEVQRLAALNGVELLRVAFGIESVEAAVRWPYIAAWALDSS